MTPPTPQHVSNTAETPQDPNWVRASSGYFYRLIKINLAPLKGLSGVIVIWYAGAKPHWVYVSFTDDLAKAFEGVIANSAIMDFETHGGLYASWSLIGKEYQPGIVRYMLDTLKPLIQDQTAPDASIEPIPVFAPGARGPLL
jgi:hypothetical protein